jgi:hypothetical protein
MHAATALNRRFITSCALLTVMCAQIFAQTKDPHRPPCTDSRCRRIKTFLKSNYCGESPFGNGPDDGCEIKNPKKPRTGVEVIANFTCKWNESTEANVCQQHLQPPVNVCDILISELRQIGLPAKVKGQIYFTVWKSAHSGWSVAEANYSHAVGSSVELCQVIVIIADNSRPILLRKLPFQKTDADIPTVSQYSLLDVAEVEGNNQEQIVLEGDAYENQWLEVISFQDGTAKTLYSGLGYYL